MKPNELEEWHKLSENLVAFTSNCSEDIKTNWFRQIKPVSIGSAPIRQIVL